MERTFFPMEMQIDIIYYGYVTLAGQGLLHKVALHVFTIENIQIFLIKYRHLIFTTNVVSFFFRYDQFNAIYVTITAWLFYTLSSSIVQRAVDPWYNNMPDRTHLCTSFAVVKTMSDVCMWVLPCILLDHCLDRNLKLSSAKAQTILHSLH